MSSKHDGEVRILDSQVPTQPSTLQTAVRVSVIIPAYNAAQTIRGCLEAVQMQTYPRESYEILVVDDGSTDETPRLAETFLYIRVLHSVHRGPAAARNLGARTATGDFILFTDADCEPASNWIEAMLAPLTNSGEDIIGAKGVYRTRQRQLVARFVQLECEEKYAQMSQVRYIDFVDTFSAAYSRHIFLANNGFDESFPMPSGEDIEFSFRLAEQGYKMSFAQDAVVYHHHVENIFAYTLRKFRIGYWRLYVHRFFPKKIWHDSYTPVTLKLQIALILLLVPVSMIAILLPIALLFVLFLLIVFILSGVPLTLYVASRDPMIILIAPIMIFLRALALGAGLWFALCNVIWHNFALRGEVVKGKSN